MAASTSFIPVYPFRQNAEEVDIPHVAQSLEDVREEINIVQRHIVILHQNSEDSPLLAGRLRVLISRKTLMETVLAMANNIRYREEGESKSD
jgi:hypothetical protein